MGVPLLAEEEVEEEEVEDDIYFSVTVSAAGFGLKLIGYDFI